MRTCKQRIRQLYDQAYPSANGLLRRTDNPAVKAQVKTKSNCKLNTHEPLHVASCGQCVTKTLTGRKFLTKNTIEKLCYKSSDSSGKPQGLPKAQLQGKKKKKASGSTCMRSPAIATEYLLNCQPSCEMSKITLILFILQQKLFYHFSGNWLVLSKQMHLASDVSEDQLLINMKP